MPLPECQHGTDVKGTFAPWHIPRMNCMPRSVTCSITSSLDIYSKMKKKCSEENRCSKCSRRLSSSSPKRSLPYCSSSWLTNSWRWLVYDQGARRPEYLCVKQRSHPEIHDFVHYLVTRSSERTRTGIGEVSQYLSRKLDTVRNSWGGLHGTDA